MVIENREAFRRLSLEMKAAVTAANTTGGVEFQPAEAKEAIINFTNKGLQYLRDRSRDAELGVSEAFAEIEQRGGSRSLGLTVLLNAIALHQEAQGNEW